MNIFFREEKLEVGLFVYHLETLRVLLLVRVPQFGNHWVKPISPPPNWPQQSTFETRRHNHFKCCTTSKN